MKKLLEGRFIFAGLLFAALLVLVIGKPIHADAKTITTVTTLNQDTTWNEDVTVNSTLYLNGYKLTVNGNVTANASVYVDRTSELVVNGNYMQAKSYLEIDSSAVVSVSGNMLICGKNSSGYTTGTGYIINNYGCLCNVGGDFYFDSTTGCYDSGTLTVKGNYTDKKGDQIFSTINFNGTKQQIIKLQKDSYIYDLKATNKNLKVNEYFAAGLGSDVTLQSDSPVISIYKKLDLNGHKCVINASVNAYSYINTDDGTLTVKGNYTQAEDALDFYGGTINISGNLNVCGLDSDGNKVTGKSSVSVNSFKSCVANVDGNLYVDTTGSFSGSGVLNLKGNYTDKKGSKLFGTVNLTGTSQQTLKLTKKSSFNCLKATNTKIKTNGNFAGTLGSDITLSSSQPTITFNSRTDLDGFQLTCKCSVISNDTVNVDSGSVLTVNGDLTHTNNNFAISDNGQLIVTGDLNICGLTSSGEKTKGGGWLGLGNKAMATVNGNYYADHGGTGSFPYGTLKLKGNYVIKSGGVSFDTVKLVGNVSKTKTQKVSLPSGSKINNIVCKSCLSLYDIPKTAYKKISYTHAYNLGEITKQPTTSANGTITYACKYCGEKSTTAIPYKSSVKPPKFTVENASGGIKISWNAVTGAGKYVVFRKKSSGNWKGIGETTGTSFVDEAGTSGVYFYTVLCMKSNGTVICDYDHTGKKAAPVITPTVKQVTNGIKITYSAYSKAAKYRIFKKTGSGAWAKLTTTTNLTYTDKAVKDGTKYTYAVVALNSSGTALTDQGSGVSITYKAPAKTVQITLKSVAAGVKITWTKFDGAGKYRVFRKKSDGTWNALGTVKAEDTLLFRDTTAVDGKKYTYTVVAMNSSGKALSEYGDGQSITYKKPVSDAEVVEATILDENGNTVVIIAGDDEFSMDIIEVNPEDTEELSEDSDEEIKEDTEEVFEDGSEDSSEDIEAETTEDTEDAEDISEDTIEESKEEIEGITEDTGDTEEISEDAEDTEDVFGDAEEETTEGAENISEGETVEDAEDISVDAGDFELVDDEVA